MNKIVIVIRENAVVAVDGIPIDVVIEVRNYDVAKVEKHKISRDTNGQEVQEVNVQELHVAESKTKLISQKVIYESSGLQRHKTG